jgi:hypothetical protein
MLRLFCWLDIIKNKPLAAKLHLNYSGFRSILTSQSFSLFFLEDRISIIFVGTLIFVISHVFHGVNLHIEWEMIPVGL